MRERDICQALCVVMTTVGLVATRDEACNQRMTIAKGQTVTVDLLQSSAERGDCIMEFSTESEWRVVLTFDYDPYVTHSSVADDCVYAPDYLLIGNDFTAIGQELLTSYKFCQRTLSEEIVSRDSYLWLVLNKSLDPHRHTHHHHLLTLNVTALPEVSCSDSEWECSPVQCIPSSAVCDGHRDCDNGFDEYCYDFGKLGTALTNPDHSQETRDRQLLPPEGSTCFLCREGTCILPRVARYDDRWGEWLWYLCDGIKHCPDGWDEQAYLCYLSRHFPDLANSNLFQCEAFDLPAPVSRQVRMWSLARCDDRRDCRLQEEEGESRCDNMLGVASTDVGSDLHLNPLALCLVIVFTIVIIVCAVFVFRYFERVHDINGVRSIRLDNRAHPDSSSELQSCLAIKSVIVDTEAFPSMTHQDFERLRETSV